MDYCDALDTLRPEQECFALPLSDNTIEGSKDLFRGRSYLTRLAGFIAPSQPDMVTLTRFRGATVSRGLSAHVLTARHSPYLLAVVEDDCRVSVSSFSDRVVSIPNLQSVR